MKNIIYILAAGLLLVLVNACNKDNSELSKKLVPEVIVNGLQSGYSVNTYQDFLRLDPVIENETEYSYYWTILSKSFQPDQGLVKADTVSKSKKLDYEVKLNPGQYFLVFNAKHQKTGVTKQVRMDLTVTTQNLNGWYLLKDNGTTTDFDFIYTGGRTNNLIATYNGKGLEGTAIRAVYNSDFLMSPTSTDPFSAFTVISSNDAGVFRIDNGKQMYNFDNMFFQKPLLKRPQALFEASNNSFTGIINDGKVYNMYRGGLFANMPPNNYDLSPVTSSVYYSMVFDKITRSYIFVESSYFIYPGDNIGMLKNIKADLQWSSSLPYPRSVIFSLFRNAQDTGYLFKLDASYGPMNGSGNLVAAIDTLRPQHGLMSADVIASNYDADYFYYAKSNKIYLMDFATANESLQLTLPAGEAVTCMQHIKFPQPGSGVTFTTDFFAVATYSGGHYKVYLHKLTSTGAITPLPGPDFEGEGRVSTMIYMENGIGSRIF